MDTDIIGPEAARRRQVFFSLLFGNASGYMCLAFLTSSRQFTEVFYKYPEQLKEIHEAIDEHVYKGNVYFCCQLLNKKERKKENVSKVPFAWADLDSCPPERMLVQPSIVIETSPGRFQAFWELDREYDADDVEDLSRRIAYKHAEEGADRSGWDLTQLVRVPNTINVKYQNTPVTKLIRIGREKYRMSDFEEYPQTPQYERIDEEMPPVDLSIERARKLLSDKGPKLNPMIERLFLEEPAKDWSKELWKLLHMLYEGGFAKEDAFCIVANSACNKYARDNRPIKLLWKEVVRAYSKAKLNEQLMVPKVEEFIPLLSEEEAKLVEQAPTTFIERYIRWASNLGDAAPQYHQAGAFVILSSLLCGSIKLPTSFGTIIPNIWFMILADTTLTRKTTSMDLAMDIVMEIDEDIVMATDGSLEGLLSSLSIRPGRPSVFLRDEFSGLLEAMSKKDYMAGMAELLTKLYDGKFQKRILRKEVIQVNNPRLIVFAGGIKEKVSGLLTHEMVASGFMPRFVFITAESDIARVRPIGPPTHTSTGDRDAIVAELRDLHKHYTRTETLEIAKLKSTITQNVVTDAVLTDDAWYRYNKLETLLLQIGLREQQADIMTPVGDRLAKSILKAALLIAASRQKEDKIVVEEIDLLRAIKYGQVWFAHARDVISNVGRGPQEKLLDNIARMVARNPSGVTRSVIMQNWHLNARETSNLFETLEQRGHVVRIKNGRAEILQSTAEYIRSRDGTN